MKKCLPFSLLCCHFIIGIFIFSTASTQPITTEKVIDLNQFGGTYESKNPDKLIAVNDLLYFTADVGERGRELWRSDGTTIGTFMLKNINPTLGESSYPTELTKVGSFLFFKAYDGQEWRLCKTDGTTAGTTILPDIDLFGAVPNTTSTIYLSYIQAGPGNTCLFFGGSSNYTYKLYQSDGTTAGTSVIKTLSIGYNDNQFQDDPTGVRRIYPSAIMYNGTHIYFTAANGSYGTSSIRRMWKSDFTNAGTVFAGAECSMGEPTEFIRTANNDLLFDTYNSSCVGNGLQLYKITQAGQMSFVKLLHDKSLNSIEYIEYKGRYYFVTMTGFIGGSDVELWETDGTSLGTKFVKSLNKGLNDIGYHITNPTNFSFELYDSFLYIAVNDEQEDYSRWWKSDGTAAGTDILSGISLGSRRLAATNNNLYFIGSKNNYLTDGCIWQTDGNYENTAMIPIPDQAHYVGDLANMNNIVYFFTGNELWKTKTCNGSASTGGLATTDATTEALPIEKQYIYDNGNCGNLIARIFLNGNANRTGLGNATAKVWVDAVASQDNFVRRHYQLQLSSDATTRSGWVTLYFTQEEFDDFNAVRTNFKKLPTSSSDAAGKANLRISKYPGISDNSSGLPDSYASEEQIINPTDEDIEYIARAGHWKISFFTTGFSGFFVHTTELTVLPLELVSFTATAKNSDALLQWKTANEQNLGKFELERSTDGSTYIIAATVPTGGNSYFKLLENEAQYGNKLFYRLKIVDKDGSVAYSNLTAVMFEGSFYGITNLYPNPIKSKLTVVGNKANYQLVLTNTVGQLFGTYQINQPGSIQIDFTKMPKGIYIVQANYADGKKQQFKVVRE